MEGVEREGAGERNGGRGDKLKLFYLFSSSRVETL